MTVSRRRLIVSAAIMALPARAALAQDARTEAFRALNEAGRYLPLYLDVLRTPDALTPQVAAFVGDEPLALRDARSSTLEEPELPAETEALDAFDVIAESIAGRRIVMVNEAHVASRHRQFFAALLPLLRREGFTHIAAEAFANPDEGHGFIEAYDGSTPLERRAGFYLNDPVYAEMIRSAAALGFRFWPYEQTDAQRAASSGAFLDRERHQAENFAARLAIEPNARVAVLAGYGHIRKPGPMFAGVLQELTGERILAIEQASLGSFGPHAQDSRVVTEVMARHRPERPVVLRAGGRLWSDPETDMAVFHPSLPDRNGRPGWLAASIGRRPKRLAVSGSGLRLARAVHLSDPPGAVPADQRLVTAEPEVVFYLRPGPYRLELETSDTLSCVNTFTV